MEWKETEQLFLDCRFDECLPLLEEAAKEGSGRAMYELGIIYRDNLSKRGRDEEKARSLFDSAVAAGEPLAQFALIEGGAPLGKEQGEALFSVIEEEAVNGGMMAAWALGTMLYKGIGTEKDEEEGVRWLSVSAEKGYFRAMDDLGMINREQDGHEKQEEAFRLFLHGAGKNFKDAEFHMGECYFLGKGVPVDYGRAIISYGRALSHRSGEAAEELGMMHFMGDGTEKDVKEAIRIFKKGALIGSAGCECRLGEFHALGIGMKKSEEEALKWYKKAWSHGYLPSAGLIGQLYQTSEGKLRDVKKAAFWFGQAAETGDTASLCRLADCCLKGIGVEKNEERAEELYRKAADLGSAEAMTRLGSLLAEQGEEKEAADLFEKAAEQNHGEAELMLGVCCDNGIGVAEDREKAKEYLKRAMEHGSPEIIDMAEHILETMEEKE